MLFPRDLCLSHRRTHYLVHEQRLRSSTHPQHSRSHILLRQKRIPSTLGQQIPSSLYNHSICQESPLHKIGRTPTSTSRSRPSIRSHGIETQTSNHLGSGSESSYTLGRRRGKISSPQPRTSTHQGTIPQPPPSIVIHLRLSLSPLFLSLLYSHTWCLRPDLRVVTGACPFQPASPRSCDLIFVGFPSKLSVPLCRLLCLLPYLIYLFLY